MMKGKSLAIVLVVLMLLSGVTACGGSTNSAGSTGENISTAAKNTSTDAGKSDMKYDPFGKYDKTVVMNIGRSNNTATNLPSPDTMESNLFLKFIEQKLNVQVKYEWLQDASTYDQKVNLAISSGDIPEVMIVYSETQLRQLVENDMVQDITETFDKTASPFVKGFYDSYGDRKFTTAMFDGKMMAVPSLNPGYQFGILWVRKDWMDKVGASAPKTMDEVINLAKTFVDKDPGGNGSGKTVGFALQNWVAGSYNSFPSMDAVFNYSNAYPRQWIKDTSGKYTYGSITPEVKTALGKIAEMYKNGLIDKEFAVRKSDDVNALLVSGKCGIFFGPWWTPYWPLADGVKNNPEADWQPYLAPLDQKGNFNVYRQDPHGAWIVVRKDYEYPEAVMKVLNVEYTGIKKTEPEAAALYKDLNVNWGTWPLPLQLDYDDMVPQQFAHLKVALESKDSSKLTMEELGFYNNIVKNNENPKKDIAAWSDSAARFNGMQVTSSPDLVKIFENVFPGQTKTMETKWANLVKLENETYLKIILGEASIDSFDKFVQEWKAQGGDEIIKEVAEVLDK